tara:strand:+ start:1439 stop:1891 length:453 start_codon:yes stop_codon:yes gene_type:complete
MSQIPEMMNGNALNHDIPVEPGFGLKVKGQTALLTALSGATSLLSFRGQAIDMADATHTLLVTGTAAAAQTVITSNFLVVDPGGNDENLDLPAEALCTGLLLFIFNSANAAEDIVVRNDAAGTILTIEQNESGLVYCDGTTWRGLVGGAT